MNLRRGDVILAFYPFTAGIGGSRRPALVVQSDFYNQRIRNTIIAQIATNVRRANDPTHLLIEAATPEGRQAGLLHDSVISSIILATIDETRIDRMIGSLTPALVQRVDDCLKASLGLP